MWLLTLPPRPSAWLIVTTGAPLLVLASWLTHRTTLGSWRSFGRHTWDLHVVAGALLVALGVQFQDTHGITTDGVIYFTQLRSVVFDGDLDVAREFAYLQQPPRPGHVVPIGPTLVWLPLYLGVAAVDGIGRTVGWWDGPANPVGVGLTLPYVRAALLSSFAIGAAGLLLMHARLRSEFGAAVACATTLLLFGATPLVWYMVYEPSMTHAASFGFVACFVVAAERWTSVGMTAARAVLLGGLLGLAFVTRPQEALFAIFPAMLLAAAHAPWRARLAAAGRLAGWALVGVAPFLLLQALHTWVLMRREAFAVVGSGGYLDPWQSRWADTLWSSWHGFLSWTPVAYIALVGIAFYMRRHRGWAGAALVLVFAMAWVNGSAADWAAGWSFGGRRFVSTLVVLAPGLAIVLHALLRRPLVPLWTLALGAVVWHQLLEAQYRRGWLQPGEPVPFAQIVRQQAALATASPFFYPFAFPANVWFAWRHGLPLEAYDLLGPETLRRAPEIAMGVEAGKYLGRGWGAHVSDPFGELRWLDAERGDMLVPLALAGESPVVLEVEARTRRVEPQVDAPLTVRVGGVEVGRFVPPVEAAATARFELPAGAPWRHGFNRVEFEKPPDTPPVGIYRVAIRRADDRVQ